MARSSEGGWVAMVAALILAAYGGGRAASAGDEPISLVDHLKAQGRPSDFEARRALYLERVGGDAYRGTFEQNTRLLAALRGRPLVAHAARGAGGASPPAGAALRTVEQEGLTITYDLAPLRLALDLPADVRWQSSRGPRDTVLVEPDVAPTLPPTAGGFVSAAVLALKAKQFDDGLYAAVELAVQGGAGGKADLLTRLRAHLRGGTDHDGSSQVAEAAARLGEVEGAPLRALDAPVAARLREFDADALRSKPSGFYTWSLELERVFRQDRMLQSPLEPHDAAAVLREHLGAERLAAMHRLTAEGPVVPTLAEELDAMERLLRGAAETSRHELGLPTDATPAGATARVTFAAWVAVLSQDPDFARDARMMVPLGRDTRGGPMRVWVFLGWTEQPLDVQLVRPPRLVRASGVHERDAWDGNVQFTIPYRQTIVSPVVAEILTHRLLDRAQMRALCDQHKTRGAILAALSSGAR